MTDWQAKRILKELCDPPRRRAVLTAFWRDAEDDVKKLVAVRLARELSFREETLRKAPLEKKAELLGYRLNAPELQEPLEIGLMVYHTSDRKEMLAAFLDEWKIPHEGGSIEVEEYPIPDEKAVNAAVESLRARYDMRDILVYLATAGLLMGNEQPAWRESTWPVVERLQPSLTGAAAG